MKINFSLKCCKNSVSFGKCFFSIHIYCKTEYFIGWWMHTRSKCKSKYVTYENQTILYSAVRWFTYFMMEENLLHMSTEQCYFQCINHKASPSVVLWQRMENTTHIIIIYTLPMNETLCANILHIYFHLFCYIEWNAYGMTC